MRHIRNSAIALLVATSAVALAASGIEVLSVDPQPDGSTLVTTHVFDAPPGSTLQAVMVLEGGLEIIVDIRPVLWNGIEVLRFPMNHPGNRIELRGLGGELLSSEPYDGVWDLE